VTSTCIDLNNSIISTPPGRIRTLTWANTPLLWKGTSLFLFFLLFTFYNKEKKEKKERKMEEKALTEATMSKHQAREA
jgi:hypothetical protein